MRRKLRILSVYEGFFTGGARILHSDVVAGLQEAGHSNTVLSVNSRVYREHTDHPMEKDKCYKILVKQGVKVESLGRTGTGTPDLTPLSSEEKNKVQRLVDEADIILTLKEQPLRIFHGVTIEKPLIVCLHRSDPENQGEAFVDLISFVHKKHVSLCVFCARTARDAYVSSGLSRTLSKVVINGVDLDVFRQYKEYRNEIRTQLAIPKNVPVVVYAARFDDMKNVPLFVQSAKMYLMENMRARIIMCGSGMNRSNKKLATLLHREFENSPELLKRIHLMGVRTDMYKMYNAADIVALTSRYGEAYPLCLLEGMACGAIPVSTNVGDAKYMLQNGSLGIITKQTSRSIVDSWHLAYSKRRVYQNNIDKVRISFDRRLMIERYERLVLKAYHARVKANNSVLSTGSRSI